MKRQLEALAIECVNEMCIESTEPDIYEKWVCVKEALSETRQALKQTHLSEITDEDAQEIGYDSAISFIEDNKEYADGVGLLSARSFKYLISKGYNF